MKSWQLIICPHCRFENRLNVEYTKDYFGTEKQLALCDAEEGGCDQYFAIKIKTRIDVTSHGVDWND